MTKKKLSKKEHLERILAQLRNGPATSAALRAYPGGELPRSSLKDYLDALRNQGYEIEQKPRGTYTLISDHNDFELIDKNSPTEWYILYMMSQYGKPISYEELRQDYTDTTGTGRDESRTSSVMKRHSHNMRFSDTTFRSCLKNLRDHGYIKTVPEDLQNRRILYRIVDTSPLPVIIDNDDIDIFTRTYVDLHARSELEQSLSDLYRKITDLSGFLDAEDPGEHLLAHGRRNLPDPEMTTKLYELLSCPYRKYNLNISYITRNKTETRENIAVALIFYGLETNMIYILGENNDGISISIRLSNITEISVDDTRENSIFQSEKYKKLYHQMWSASPDAPVPVRVLFEDTRSIREKVERLHSQRKFSEISDTEYGIEYTDTVSGLSSFARFLRSFGSSAIVFEPEELRRSMIESANCILNNYYEDRK
jgi:hypothetical protein